MWVDADKDACYTTGITTCLVAFNTNYCIKQKLFFGKNVTKKKKKNIKKHNPCLQRFSFIITILLSCYRFDNMVVNGAGVKFLVDSDHLKRLKINAPFSKGHQ